MYYKMYNSSFDDSKCDILHVTLDAELKTSTIFWVKVHYSIMIRLVCISDKYLPCSVVCDRNQHHCGCQHPRDDVLWPDGVQRFGEDAHYGDDDFVEYGCVAIGDVEVGAFDGADS